MATLPVDWPDTLPSCPQSWSEQDNPDMLESSVDVGAAKYRRRSTLKKTRVSLTWVLKAELYEFFMFFYETTLQQGSIPFLFPHPLTGVMTPYYFKSAPQISLIAGRKGVGAFQVSIQIEADQ